VAKKEPRAKRTRMIASHEHIHVAHVIWLENNDCTWLTRIEPTPRLC
jgi:hypothetical protein